MMKAVQELSGIPAPWEKFLLFDRNMNRTMVRESKTAGIEVLNRDPAMSTEELVSLSMISLGFMSQDSPF